MSRLTPEQQRMVEVWEEHLGYEFRDHDADKTVSTMVEDAYVNHVPTMAGGSTREGLRQFYGQHFVKQVPPDWKITPISRTVGENLLVDEMINEFTHTVQMDWIFPGIPPTGRKVTLALVVVAHFRDGKLAHEHIYWDQASALVQIGLLDPTGLPVRGTEAAEKVRASRAN